MRWIYMSLMMGVTALAIANLFHAHPAFAQDSGPASISPHLESAVILSDGDTIRFLNVPEGSGLVDAKRFDITCKLSFNADGSLRINSSFAVPTTIVPNLADQFVPGMYVDSYGEIYTLRGPAISIGGRTTWSLHRENVGANENQKSLPAFIATWTTGPVVGSPELANQTDLKTLPAGFAYGLSNGLWPNAISVSSLPVLLGARQIGDSIQIASFRDSDNSRQEGYAFIITPYSASK